ncbi:unnamed protein product, partial [Mesorhabditis belari]|uniref:Uncharacterized protein n=1 Tax=Mesorhabditis belari TaxID=2138241 RepID=A0AAF3EUZ2_9BILA
MFLARHIFTVLIPQVASIPRVCQEQRADGKFVETFEDYHPYIFQQALQLPHHSYPSFSAAVDEFYAKQETQKLEQKALNIEKEAIKKLNNVKKDQKARILALEEAKRQQEIMGERIVLNESLIERALMVMRTMIASRSDWSAIEQLWKQAVQSGDETATRIVKLELESNQFVMRLGDPFNEEEPLVDVKIDSALNAYQNSRKYFVDKKAADVKKGKTKRKQRQLRMLKRKQKIQLTWYE